MFEDKLQKEMEHAILSNKYLQILMRIKDDPIIDRKLDIRVAVRLEDTHDGIYHWIGHLLVMTDQIKFTERRIFDYENWQTDAENMGWSTYNNILMRGLFVIEARGQ